MGQAGYYVERQGTRQCYPRARYSDSSWIVLKPLYPTHGGIVTDLSPSLVYSVLGASGSLYLATRHDPPDVSDTGTLNLAELTYITPVRWLLHLA